MFIIFIGVIIATLIIYISLRKCNENIAIVWCLIAAIVLLVAFYLGLWQTANYYRQLDLIQEAQFIEIFRNSWPN